MYFCPLFSGSSGNALFCQYGNTRLLVDAGKPGRQVEEALRSIGAEPETLAGILITHEHSDHIHGAGILARKYHLPLYATAGTWAAMEGKIGKIDPGLRREIQAGRDFWLGDMGVVPFPIPHDAADPVGFRLYGGSLSVSTATDLGHFSRYVYDQIAGSDLILLESNHDPDMLRANPHYSAQLKARILGEHGHLSNASCAEALIRLIAAGTGTVLLGHLSGENNTPELARRVSTEALNREGIRPGRDIQLNVALRDRTGPVYVIRERS
ncbi:MAG: MBL fold metallo-hydrolase [Clostridiales bacterium]|nr:MBL fold metallo-hydrolase [Clostridiales bacterium]